jgi:hypothetical protein
MQLPPPQSYPAIIKNTVFVVNIIQLQDNESLTVIEGL